MYQFHTKIGSDRVKTKKQANIVHGIVAALGAAYIMYTGIPENLNTIDVILYEFFQTIRLGLVSFSLKEFFYDYKKLSKKDTQEVLNIKELFITYMECVLSI